MATTTPREDIRSIVQYAEHALDLFDDDPTRNERDRVIAEVMTQHAIALALVRIGDALEALKGMSTDE